MVNRTLDPSKIHMMGMSSFAAHARQMMTKLLENLRSSPMSAVALVLALYVIFARR